MRRIISAIVTACVVYTIMIQSACIGSFGLTKSVYDWNMGLNKWVGELVFLVLVIIPVYGIALLIDAVILNLIEFWTGSNPMSMKEGDMERQVMVGTDGNAYEVTATRNRFDIVQLEGRKAGEVNSLIYNPETKTWSHEKNCTVTPLFQYGESGESVKYFGPDGKSAILPRGISDKAMASRLVQAQFDNQACLN